MRHDRLVSALCDEIDALEFRVAKAEAEAKQWREKYDALIMQDIQHGHRLMANFVTLLTKRES